MLRIEPIDLLPALREDGSAMPDPVAAMGQNVTGVHWARIFGRLPASQQHNLLNVAKAIDVAALAAG